MRKSLAWTLAVTLVLSAVALWPPQAPAPVLAVVRQAAGQARQVEAVAAAALPAAAPGRPVQDLPAQWPVAVLEPASSDPFQPGVPAPAAAVRAPPPAPPVPHETPAPPPPPMNYRFAGRFLAPDGQPRVFLAQGDGALVEAGVGSRLEGGWSVESVKAEGVVLVYPALGSRWLLPLPPQ